VITGSAHHSHKRWKQEIDNDYKEIEENGERKTSPRKGERWPEKETPVHDERTPTERNTGTNQASIQYSVHDTELHSHFPNER
jgi:hypothetical protein